MRTVDKAGHVYQVLIPEIWCMLVLLRLACLHVTNAALQSVLRFRASVFRPQHDRNALVADLASCIS